MSYSLLLGQNCMSNVFLVLLIFLAAKQTHNTNLEFWQIPSKAHLPDILVSRENKGNKTQNLLESWRKYDRIGNESVELLGLGSLYYKEEDIEGFQIIRQKEERKCGAKELRHRLAVGDKVFLSFGFTILLGDACFLRLSSAVLRGGHKALGWPPLPFSITYMH